MTELALAFDLGTGGCKASLWSADGECVAETVHEYPTSHPGAGRNEQRPADWWAAVASATTELLSLVRDGASRVAGIALSGQSLGVVALDDRLELVSETTPIWSDTRGAGFTAEVFDAVPEPEWYLRTGNGFGAALYPLFKLIGLRTEAPEAWSRTRHVLGSKDWINLRLTGRLATDHSYASGSGAYSLAAGAYDDELLEAAGVPRTLLPEPVESHDEVGRLTTSAAEALGLPAGTPVFAGAVDNACMALGSLGTRPGRIYAALGSSSWMTVTSERPVLDLEARPYVFRHAVPGLHISALSTFSSGTSLTWLRDLVAPGTPTGEFISLGLAHGPGARGALFLPMLAGGTPIEGGPDARGALVGLDLGHDAGAVARAALEGVAFALRRSLDRIRTLSGVRDGALLVSGGGARHDGWNQLYADVLGSPLVRTSVDQQAATLGAATIAFVGLGLWSYVDAERPHRLLEEFTPAEDADDTYAPFRERFDRVVEALAPRHPLTAPITEDHA
jgi:xylulokinase